MRRKSTWLMQMVTITQRGIDDFTAGVARDAGPYHEGHRNNQGPGGNLQRKRREAWLEGWKLAEKEAVEKAVY